jgi:hypothetical protein
VDALGKFANSRNEKILFMPLEASSVIGAIGGIAEIARQSFGKGGDGAEPPRPWGDGSRTPGEGETRRS